MHSTSSVYGLTNKMFSLKKIFLFSFILFYLLQTANSQIKQIGIPFIQNFSQNDYNSGFQNWSVTQDKRGYFYIANNNSVLIFDGRNWKSVQTSNKGDVRSLFCDNTGRIWVGGFNEIGYLTIDSLNSIVYKSLKYKIPEKLRNFNQVWNIYQYNDKLFAETPDNIFIFSKNSFKAIQSENGIHSIFKVNDDIYIKEWNSGIYKFQNDTLQLLKNSEIFANEKIYSILQFNNDTLLVASRTTGLYKFDGTKFDKWGSEFLNNYLIEAEVYCGLKIQPNYFAYGTLHNGILIIDNEGNIIQNIDTQKGLISNVVYNLYLDNFNNLWVATSEGISVIEIMSPYSIFNAYHGITSKPVIIDYLNGFLYCGGEQNFYCCNWFDINNINEKNIFNPIKNTNNQSWGSVIFNDNLILSHNPGLISIKGNEIENNFDYENQNIWAAVKIPDYKDLFLAGTNKGFLLLQYTDKFIFKNKIAGFNQISRFFSFDSISNLWLSIPTEGVYKLKLNNELDSFEMVNYYGDDKGLPDNFQNFIFNIRNDIVFYTDEKLYWYDYNLDTMVLYPKYQINKLTNKINTIFGEDSIGNLWFEDDISFAYINLDDKNPVINRNIATELNDKSVIAFFPLDENNLFFGYTDGLLHLDQSISYNFDIKYNTFIQQIEYIANDSLIFGGNFVDKDSSFTNIQSEDDVKYFNSETNSLRFKVSAGFYQDSEQIKYKYKLEGYDDNWSSWTKEYTKEYTNLSAGEYIFRAVSINSYGNEGNEVSYKFFIKPAWYKTTVAYIFYFTLFVCLIFIVLKINTNRLKKRSSKLEAKIAERTFKIQLQKTELEMQKEEIQTQAEELEKINKELVKLSIVASETDNAILVMDPNGYFEWVNPAFTKIFGYTLEELMTDVSRNIIGQNTSENIKNLINECIDDRKTVEYELKTTNKRGNEIWVHTTLTPVLDHEGRIKNLIAIDSDITKHKDAEAKIQFQNENIRGSIKYALTIQNTIMPSKEEMDKLFENFIIYRPKDIVSGDFYWLCEIPLKVGNVESNFNFLTVVDCTGHGVPGAFMSLIGSRLLNEIIVERKVYSPKRILELLDVGVQKVLKQSQTENNDGMDISICRFEKTTVENKILTKIIYSGAKLPVIYYTSESNSIQKTEAARSTIGGKSNISNDFTNTEIVLGKGDFIFMFSDGLRDQNNVGRKKFGTSRTNKILIENINQPLEVIKQKIEDSLDEWKKGAEQRDDITFIGIRI